MMVDERLKRALESIEDDCDYADARYITTTHTFVSLSDGTPFFNGTNDAEGVGIRVLTDNGWGFASGALEEAEKTAKRALKIAELSAVVNKGRAQIRLQPYELKESERSYVQPVIHDPFAMPRSELFDLLTQVDKNLRASHVKGRDIELSFKRVIKQYCNTEGFHTTQQFQYVDGGMEVRGVHKGEAFKRSYEGFCLTAQGGLERIKEWDFNGNAARIRDELKELMLAKPCPQDTLDLVLHPSQLYLQTHENGHGFEFDRILNYEIGFAGGSFLRPEDLNKLKYGSEKVNIRADATYPNAAGTFGFDDDGMPAQNMYLVKNGIVNRFLGSRQMVMEGDLPREYRNSSAAMRAEDAEFTPLVRMTNVFLEPGKDGSLSDLIAATDNGILMQTNRSWSIDNYRRNFHFGTEVGWLIRNGKLREMVKHPNYQGETVAFWNSCDMVGSEPMMFGVSNCGKGQPGQSMYCGHPTPPARFRNVRVGVGGSAGGSDCRRYR